MSLGVSALQETLPIGETLRTGEVGLVLEVFVRWREFWNSQVKVTWKAKPSLGCSCG